MAGKNVVRHHLTVGKQTLVVSLDLLTEKLVMFGVVA